MDSTNLAYNSGPSDWYLLVNNIYYHRDNKGWHVLPPEQAPALENFFPMHEKQEATYTKQLKEQGLIE